MVSRRRHDKKRLHARDRGASGDPAHVRGSPRRADEPATQKKRLGEKKGFLARREHAGVPVSRRILTNVRVRRDRESSPRASSARLRISAFSFFANSTERRRRSISSLSVFCPRRTPPLASLPLFVSDLNLRPSYQLSQKVPRLSLLSEQGSISVIGTYRP